MTVMGRVAASHEPLLVNIGVRSWKARRVPVGRRLARLATVLVRFRTIVGCRCRAAAFGVSAAATTTLPLAVGIGVASVVLSFMDGCLVVVDLALRVAI